jgi:hypothetical protein
MNNKDILGEETTGNEFFQNMMNSGKEFQDFVGIDPHGSSQVGSS